MTEIDALEQKLDADLASLATEDCTIACAALESMVRSAEKICEIEPGPRCDAARSKVADARRRVEQACPDCLAAEEPQIAPPPERKPSPMPDSEEIAKKSSMPPASEKRGGCAACTVGQRGENTTAPGWLLLALVVWPLRRTRPYRPKGDRLPRLTR